MLSLAQLQQPMTSRQFLAVLMLYWESVGLPTSWLNGAIQKSIATAVSRVGSDVTEFTRILVQFCFSEYSSGDLLSELSDNQFDNQRIDAVSTAGPLILTSTAAVPYTINPGQLIARSATGHVRYSNTTGGTLAAGGQLIPQWESLLGGAEGNILALTPLVLETALAGVSIATPTIDPWYTTEGRDPERDDTLKRRNRTKWATLGIELVRDGYINLALNTPGITRADVIDNNPRGPGTIDVLVGSGSGLPSTAAMEALQTTLAGRVLGTDSAWPANASSWAAVFAADVLTLSLVGEVYFDPKYIQTTVQTNVNQALRDWAATLPIGGLDYSPGPPNAVLRSDLYAIIESVRGVRGVQLTSPNEQFLASARSLIVPSTINLSYTATVSSGP